jgi:hypothetical protein
VTLGLVSSCYGAYDTLACPPSAVDDAVMVTDSQHTPAGWRRVFERRPWVPPRLAAKHAKARPDRYTDADVIVWADANLTITGEIVAWAGEPGPGTLVAYRHPWLTDVTAEAQWAVQHEPAKYQGMALAAQAEHYADRTVWPEPDAHVWSGLLAAHADTWSWFGDAWLAEMVRWGTEDQVSLPPVLRACGVALDVREQEPPESRPYAWRPHAS